ncbi:hypothetical protein, partial [Parvimonas micra]|uniref:hypothetical protein n=1 Tax=Parvimonas micra TaxID=33033 RepID=UPI002B4989B2
MQQGHYHFRLELPRQSVLEKGAMTPQLLRQAELHLTGADLNLHLRYQNPNGPQGEARFDPSRLSLANGEALILQLANT